MDNVFDGPEELLEEAAEQGLISMIDIDGIKSCDPRDVRILSMRTYDGKRVVLIYTVVDYKEYIKFLLEVIRDSTCKHELIFLSEEIDLCLCRMEKINASCDNAMRSVLINKAMSLFNNDEITDKDIASIGSAKTVEDLLNEN